MRRGILPIPVVVLTPAAPLEKEPPALGRCRPARLPPPFGVARPSAALGRPDEACYSLATILGN